MELEMLIRALRAKAAESVGDRKGRPYGGTRCLGCGYEHNCSIHGCRVMKLAADELERLRKIALDPDSVSRAEKQAVFRLGQMDMQQSILSMIQHVADNTLGASRQALLDVADIIEAIEVQP